MLFKERRERIFASASGFESLNHTGVVVSQALMSPSASSNVFIFLSSWAFVFVYENTAIYEKIKILALTSVSEYHLTVGQLKVEENKHLKVLSNDLEHPRVGVVSPNWLIWKLIRLNIYLPPTVCLPSCANAFHSLTSLWHSWEVELKHWSR